jgi:uncharacterized hydantoinase/oxoprolinase family protein
MSAATKQNEVEFAKQLTLRGLSSAQSEAGASVATQNQVTTTATALESAPPEANEMANLKQVIVAWRELNGEVSDLNSQIREKRKKLKTLEEMILRIMKKHNIGALDLKGSGGRLLYRRQSSKIGLNPKTLSGLLADHLKSEKAATDALAYINEHRGAKVRESLLYEKE